MIGTYHSKTVAHPEPVPAVGTLGNVHVLAVHGDHVGLGLADNAPEINCHYNISLDPLERLAHIPRDVLPDGVVRHGHHGDGGVGGEPVGLVVPAGVVADVVEVAEEEGHRAEPVDAGTGHA